jgi:hypothetical protein
MKIGGGRVSKLLIPPCPPVPFLLVGATSVILSNEKIFWKIYITQGNADL